MTFLQVVSQITKCLRFVLHSFISHFLFCCRNFPVATLPAMSSCIWKWYYYYIFVVVVASFLPSFIFVGLIASWMLCDPIFVCIFYFFLFSGSYNRLLAISLIVEQRQKEMAKSLIRNSRISSYQITMSSCIFFFIFC